MDFKRKLKTRLYTAITYILIGGIFIAMYLCNISENQYLLTLGIALAVMAVIRLIAYMRITKDDESIKRQEIAENDERNIAIIHKAKSTAFGLYVFLVATIIIILELLGITELTTILALNLCGIVVLYWLCYYIYHKII